VCGWESAWIKLAEGIPQRSRRKAKVDAATPEDLPDFDRVLRPRDRGTLNESRFGSLGLKSQSFPPRFCEESE
jgi:hypothetical protein